MSNSLHDMYKLLQECGEDTSCGCGCGDEEEDEGGKKPKSKKADKSESVAERAKELLAEARRKIGLRRFRNMRRVAQPASGRASKLRAGKSATFAVRTGAVHNRHR